MTETAGSYRIWLLEEDGKRFEVYVCAPFFDPGTLATDGYTVANEVPSCIATETGLFFALPVVLRKTGGSEQPASLPSNMPPPHTYDEDRISKWLAGKLLGGQAVGNEGEAIKQLSAKLKAIFTSLIELTSNPDTPVSELQRRIPQIMSAATI